MRNETSLGERMMEDERGMIEKAVCGMNDGIAVRCLHICLRPEMSLNSIHHNPLNQIVNRIFKSSTGN